MNDVVSIAQWDQGMILNPGLNQWEAHLLSDRRQKTENQVFILNLWAEVEEAASQSTRKIVDNGYGCTNGRQQK